MGKRISTQGYHQLAKENGLELPDVFTKYVDKKDVPQKTPRHLSFPVDYACTKCREVFPREVFLNSSGKKTNARCPDCRKKDYIESKEKRKSILSSAITTRAEFISVLGGKCQRCGYNEFATSLHFHHKDPATKERMVSTLIRNYCNVPTEEKLEKLRAEASKCILLCANCHHALHAQLWKL